MIRLREHEAKHIGKPVAICAECGFKAKSFYGLKEHRNIHLRITFACEHCEKVFYNKFSLRRHVNSNHNSDML